MARGNKKGEQKITKPSTSETTKKSSSPSKSVSKSGKGTSSASSSKDTFLDKATGKGPVQTTPEQFFNQTFDSNLYRNSRIVVPVDLQIYVVENQASKSVYDLTQIFDDDERDRPREGQQQLAEGVHLHWAMPDGLMKGEEIHNPNDEVAEDVDLSEMFDFPKLPDRWLVLRHWTRSNGSGAITAWVIDSDKQEVTPLNLCRNSESTTALSALDDGIPNNGDDTGWTGTYHGSEGRFTFHENPGQDVSGPLSYSITGWYNNPTDDPLMCDTETTRGKWMDMMESLGWEYPQDEIVEMVNSKTPIQSKPMFTETLKETSLGGDKK